jgi:hypothetical protein
VSKVLSFCLEELQAVVIEDHQPTGELLGLLRTCLQRYRGPCGPFRDRLEKALVPFLDHDNADLVGLVVELLPLMSATGGSGGNNNEKDRHGQDWSLMTDKLLTASYDVVYQLYSESCPNLDVS